MLSPNSAWRNFVYSLDNKNYSEFYKEVIPYLSRGYKLGLFTSDYETKEKQVVYKECVE